MITKVNISGYKSIKEISIDLSSINVLLGSNGSGKSNLISIFSLIRNIIDKNLQNNVRIKGGADFFLHFGKKVTDKIKIELVFGLMDQTSGKIYDINKFTQILQVGQDTLFINKTETAYLGNQINWYSKIYEQNRTESDFTAFSNVGAKDQAFHVNQWLSQFQVYHFHDTGDKSPMKAPCNINDNKTLKNDGSNIAAFLYYLKAKHTKCFLRIEKIIQAIAPFFDRFNLEPMRLNENMVELEWIEKNHLEARLNAYNLSDGTLRFICLATLLMQPHPPETIIIDEPELGLHPVAINMLASLMRKVSDKAQLIVSTQSVNLVDNFKPEDIIITERGEQGSTFRRLDAESLKGWIEDFSLGDLWYKNQFGAQPYMIS